MYLGEWKRNAKSGHGRLTAPGKAYVYNGDFKNDCIEGEGKWESDDGVMTNCTVELCNYVHVFLYKVEYGMPYLFWLVLLTPCVILAFHRRDI